MNRYGGAHARVFGEQEPRVERHVVGHEHAAGKQVTQFMCDAFEIRRVQQIARGDMVHPGGTDTAIHMNQRLMLVFERTVRSHVHQADLNGPIAFRRTQSRGFEINHRESLIHCSSSHTLYSSVKQGKGIIEKGWNP